MEERELFVLADRTLLGVVEQIRDDQWDLVMPNEFATSASQGRDIALREIINSHAYDDVWVPDLLAGRTMADVGPHAFTGDLLGASPAMAFAEIVEKACAAAESLDDLDRMVHCSFGDFPAREYFWQITGFRGLRAHDIALVIGADPTLPAELVSGLWEQIEPTAEEWRVMGVFGPKVDVPADAALQDRLLGLTGRQPDGTY